jgi:hypothetical protein
MIIIDNKNFFPFSFFSPENSPFLFLKLIVFLITSLNSKWFRADSPAPNEMIVIQKKKKATFFSIKKKIKLTTKKLCFYQKQKIIQKCCVNINQKFV